MLLGGEVMGFWKKFKERPDPLPYFKLGGGRMWTDTNEMLQDPEIKKRLEEIEDLDIVKKDNKK